MKEKMFETIYRLIMRGVLTAEESYYMMKLLFENKESEYTQPIKFDWAIKDYTTPNVIYSGSNDYLTCTSTCNPDDVTAKITSSTTHLTDTVFTSTSTADTNIK